MTRQVVALFALFCVTTPVRTRGDVHAEKTWQTYVDSTYQVMLRFPASWKRNPRYSNPYFGAEARLYTVTRGFFQLDLAEDENAAPEQVCKGAAEHVLKPFGENPTIRRIKVQGQDACLVWPSEDQGAPWDAEVIVEYPQPLEIDGERWGLLELIADKDYILAIIRSLKFLSSTHQNAPFLLQVAPQNAVEPGTATWKVGTPVCVTLTLKNSSRRVLHFALSNPVLDYVMTVRKSKTDEPVGVTDSFREVQNQSRQGRAPTPNVLVTLKPKETRPETIEISRFYDLTRPGQYTVQIERGLPPELGKGIFESNTLTVTIVD